MAKKVIEFDEACTACNGTGLYVGIGEHNGAAVICRRCDGTGLHHFKRTYETFTEKKNKHGIRRVYEINPGVTIGEDKSQKITLEDFGGMTFEDWKGGKKFEQGMENRLFTCPTWWYQTANSNKKPKWVECNNSWGGQFSKCKYFSDKNRCWTRWDKEFGIK